MRKWLAGWLSCFGGWLVGLADRMYPPPELRTDYRDLMAAQRRATRWN